MNTRKLMITLLAVAAIAVALSQMVSASDWHQFHCNVEHTGYSTSNAPDTNRTAWISDDIGAHSASSVTVAGGKIFVYCWDYLVCLDEYTGDVLWNVSVENAELNRTTLCCSWVTPTYHDGRVFLPAARTYCFDSEDGSEIWAFTAPTGVGAVDGSVAIADGMVFTSDWDGKNYYCLDEEDGTQIWNFTVTDDYAQSTPAISDGNVVFGGWTWGLGGHIYCVNMTTGAEGWTFATPHHPCGSATISGDVVYMTTYNFSTTQDPGELYALNLADGSEIWSQPVERTDSTPAIAYGNVYVCGGCKGISDLVTYCFNATTGEPVWNTSASDELGNWKCSPAVADGMVFVGKPYFKDGVMDYVGTYALNASTGGVVWSHLKGGSAPAVADGMVFTIGSERVYAFGPTTVWSGDVTLGRGTFNVTADDSGKEYTINRTCALAALIRAAEAGGFNYTISDAWYADYGSLSVTSIAGRENNQTTWDGWCYWVNYPDDEMPMVGGNKFELGDGDMVTWYYGGMGSAPDSTDMLLRIETRYDYWSGDVTLCRGTFNVTADSGKEYTINRTCALASIIEAAETAGFDYSINDSWYDDYGTLYTDSIAGVSDWMYWVNYPNGDMPMVGANAYELADGDSVTWYHADSMESTPANTDMVIQVRVGFDGPVPVCDWTQFHYDVANTGNSPSDAPDTSNVKWISENISASEGSQATIVGDWVFVYISAAGADDEVCALDKATGRVAWRTAFSGETEDWGSVTAPVYDHGMVFVAAGHNVTSFDSASGEKLQEITFLDGGYLCNGGVAATDGMVFVGSGDGANYYALNASDLTDVVWNYTTTLDRAYGVPAVADNRVVFGDAGWGAENGSLYCVNESTGDLIWSTELIGLIWGSAAIDAADNRVYVATALDWGADTGKLFALEFDTGTISWSAEIRYTSGTPAVSGEYIYVSASGTAPGATYCFDKSGSLQWNVSSGSRQISPAVADGKLFTGDVGTGGMATTAADGISVYDATTGAMIWQYEHAGSSPSVAEDVNGNGIVVSIGSDGMVYAFGDTAAGVTGDANGDGTVDMADAALALQMAAGEISANEEADVNKDGSVTSVDALMIVMTV